MSSCQRIDSLEALEALYAAEPSAVSIRKVTDHVTADYVGLIEASPFVVLATSARRDSTARVGGDAPGFVRVIDSRTLQMPDRPGNNRIDSSGTSSGTRESHSSFCFPAPARPCASTARAGSCVADDVLQGFVVGSSRPRSVLLVEVEAVCFQCTRAVLRRLWDNPAATSNVPSVGEMLGRVSGREIDALAYDRKCPGRASRTLW